MALQLHVVNGPDAGRSFTLQAGPEQMLGRGKDALYHLNDPRASRSHCQLLLDGEQVTVICNGGSGGTLINGKPIDRKQLKLGDVLRVGETELRLQMGDFPLDVALGGMKAAVPIIAAPPAAATDRLENLAGKALSYYQIGHVLGKGHVAMVFFATDTKNDRPVALKVLLPEFSQNDEEMKRFVRGMTAAMALKHPNIVQTYGAGRTGPHCWVAMEFIAGENLKQVIDRIGVAGMLDWKIAFRAAVHIARALEYAHEQGIVHRTVTPTNILRDAPTQVCKLGDLTLAKSMENVSAEQISRKGELVGEVDYMAPESTRGDNTPDERCDLYGLGATVYALLTGRPPCPGKTLIEKITRIRQQVPEKPTKYQMSIPPMFEGLVMKLLSKEPKDRYASATELLKDLERIGKFGGAAA